MSRTVLVFQHGDRGCYFCVPLRFAESSFDRHQHIQSLLRSMESRSMSDWVNTYIFKTIFAELNHEVEKDQGWEPQTPHDHLFHCLDVQYSKDENKLVEDEVPEFIFEVLRGKIKIKISKWMKLNLKDIRDVL